MSFCRSLSSVRKSQMSSEEPYSSMKYKNGNRRNFYGSHNKNGSSSKGKYFTQTRKHQTIRMFNKNIGRHLPTENNQGNVGNNFVGNSHHINRERRNIEDNSIRCKKQRLMKAKEKFEEKRRARQLEKQKYVEGKHSRQKLWREEKKRRGEITRLLAQKTIKGQPKMKSQSKALLLKIQHRMGFY